MLVGGWITIYLQMLHQLKRLLSTESINGKRFTKQQYLLTTSDKSMLNQPCLWILWLKHCNEYLWTGRECHPAILGTFCISVTSDVVWENRHVTTNIILKSFLNRDFRFPPSRIQVICDVTVSVSHDIWRECSIFTESSTRDNKGSTFLQNAGTLTQQHITSPE